MSKKWDDLMYKRKKVHNKLVIVVICFVVVILLGVSLQLNRKTSFVENIFKDISMFFDKVVMYPFTSLNKENGVDQTESYLIQKNVNSSLEKEIQELKNVLDLKETLTEYKIENATILSRNKSYWFNTITIDKGKKSGIKEEMAVVTKDGLLGKISKVSNNSSEIKLITSDDVNYKISVSIQTGTGDTYAILSGYDKKSGCVIVSEVDKMSSVNVGDNIVTSGLSDKFPRGIYIGKVEKIVNDKYDVSKTLYVKTKQDFNSIHYVTVLKEKNND